MTIEDIKKFNENNLKIRSINEALIVTKDYDAFETRMFLFKSILLILEENIALIKPI
jgi:hypothetical protein